MQIVIIEHNDPKKTPIIDFDLESNPFKVGETLNLKVNNHNKEVFNAEDLLCNCRIVEIHHSFTRSFSTKQYDNFTVIVEVEYQYFSS